MKRLLVINGHPDPRPERFCGALSEAYMRGAKAGGWDTRRVNVGNIPLSAVEALSHGQDLDPDVQFILEDMEWANRLAVVFPLLFDKPPEALQAIFARASVGQEARRPAARRAHVIVTMDMPAFAYRSEVRSGAAKKSNILAIPGVIPDEPVLIGCVSTIADEQRRQWLQAMRHYGENSRCGSIVVPSRTQVFASMLDRAVGQFWPGH